MQVKKNVSVFSPDVLQKQSYKYVTYTSRLSNERMTQAINESVNWFGKSVFDIGCERHLHTRVKF